MSSVKTIFISLAQKLLSIQRETRHVKQRLWGIGGVVFEERPRPSPRGGGSVNDPCALRECEAPTGLEPETFFERYNYVLGFIFTVYFRLHICPKMTNSSSR